jgi:molybdopterin/thiamine biosynthesis adenylyltransferase
MAHLVQVGAGSGGMPVLDMLCRESEITRVTLIEPDIYKPHNVFRHMFPLEAVGLPKAIVAQTWLKERRPDLDIKILIHDLADPAVQGVVEEAISEADIGVCAADNEPAKYRWDFLMRRHAKPWTLGEVLSGGIGGFVHWFVPGGACYGCVASHLQRSVQVAKPQVPDYSQPGGPIVETTVPAGKAAIQTIAALHALVTLGLLRHPRGQYDPGFSSLLLPLERVPDIFEEAFRPYRFRIPRAAECLICRPGSVGEVSSPEELDVALDQALARLGHA